VGFFLFQSIALSYNAPYNLIMEKKILRVQLYSLFILTTLNLIYFYYRDNLPDNYYEISYSNQSINIFTYYFFTFLANFGYWSGIWVTLFFGLFALAHTFILNKRGDTKDAIYFLVLAPFCLLISYFTLPTTLGDGLYTLLEMQSADWANALTVIVSGVALFYLTSEKKFFKTCDFIQATSLQIFEALKNYDYSNLKPTTFKQSLEKLLLRFKVEKTNEVKTQVKRSIVSEKPLIQKPVQPIIEDSVDEDVLEDEVEDDEEEFEEDDEIQDELEEDDESDEEIETEEPVKPVRLKSEDKFFDSLELIDTIAPKNQSSHSHDPEDYYFEKIAKAIEDKLKEFNITAHVINVLKGPVVDTFELELGAGVKVAGVTNRTDDLSLALMGAPIRMVYPMKGKSTIGIEVPRNPRDLIYLDEVLKSETFINSTHRLPIAMGKDAYGDAAVIDLASTPHFLVAGTTGAGKSVFVNTLLVSLIIKLSPKKLRLIMIDPKQLELALYQTLPHLIMPVVTDSQIASVALLWAIDEMERRYSVLKDFGVKNIEGFNKKVTTADKDLLYKINKYYPDVDVLNFEMPYIVVVVDEFADLVLSKSGKAIENSISRLAAKARASGIHIVLATQRPSTDVITGVIKANFPTRVAFRVTTNMDSRVILDTMGAEKLLGKGDMLFKQGIETLRMHSAFVDEDEIDALVKKLSAIPAEYDSGAMEFVEKNGQSGPEIDPEMMDEAGESSSKDDKYDEAVRCVAMHRVASASFLQRRLGVGYNRAANLVEEMERQGVVGPAQGSKPRKVLIPPPSDSTP